MNDKESAKEMPIFTVVDFKNYEIINQLCLGLHALLIHVALGRIFGSKLIGAKGG